MGNHMYRGPGHTYPHLPLERDADGNAVRIAPFTLADGDVVTFADGTEPPADGRWRRVAGDYDGPVAIPDNVPRPEPVDDAAAELVDDTEPVGDAEPARAPRPRRRRT